MKQLMDTSPAVAHHGEMSIKKRLVASAAAMMLVTGAFATLQVRAETAADWPQVSNSPDNLSNRAKQSAVAIPDFVPLTQAVKPAVVSVRVKIPAEKAMVTMQGNPFEGTPFEKFFKQFGQPNGQRAPGGAKPRMAEGQGSGFFISSDGYLVTNNHVVDKASNVEVVMDDGTVLPAKVVGTDKKTDLALLKVSGRSKFPFVELAKGEPAIGSWVVAMGNPFGFGGSVTAGIVSAHGRDLHSGPYDDFIQIDAPINRGNSGGPTFNMQGKVIGVNTAIFSPTGGSVGIAFDIPAATVKAVVAQLHKKGRVDRGWLGVEIQPVTKSIADSLGLENTKGALISETMADGPAVKAGLKSGDIVTAVDDRQIKEARALARVIGDLAPHKEVKVSVLRNEKPETFTVKLGEYKDKVASSEFGSSGISGHELSALGLKLAPASSVEGAGDKGVAVLGVDPDGKAAELGIQTGDVILKIGSRDVASVEDVTRALKLAEKEGKKHTLALIRHQDSQRFIALPAAVG